MRKLQPERDESRFPVDPVTGDVLEALQRQGLCLVVAPPGAGKTTRLPLAVAEAMQNQGQVILTQPRRVAARTAADRLAESIGERVGQSVGLRTGEETVVGKHSCLTVMTEGVLARMLADDPALPGVCAVLLDEVHERSTQVDLCLAFLRDVRASIRPDLRLALLSATLDEERFGQALGAPVIRSEGRSFPLERMWEPALIAHYPQHTADVVERELRALSNGQSILVFAPGKWEIGAVARQLERRSLRDVDILTLHGGSSPAEVRQVMSPVDSTRRRVVIATNIAQTSLTIPGVRVVVDQGLIRRSITDGTTGFARLQTVRVSRATAIQRAGRAGRLGPGRAISLWSMTEDASLPSHDEPEILRSDITDAALAAVAWGSRHRDGLDWLDAPTQQAWDDAITTLRSLDAIDEHGRITAIGESLAALPLDARLGRVALAGASLPEPLRTEAIALVALLASDRRRSVDTRLPEEISLLAEELRCGNTTSDTARIALRLQAALDGVSSSPVSAQSLGGVYSLAMPARIASRHPTNAGLYTLASGVRLPVVDDDPIRGASLLVATEFDADTASGRIFSALSISADEVLTLHSSRIDSVSEVIVSNGCLDGEVRVVETKRLGAATISETRSAPNNEQLNAAVQREVTVGEITAWAAGSKLARLEERLAFLRRRRPNAGWPDVSPDGLWTSRASWLFAISANRPLRSVPPDEVARMLIEQETKHTLDQLAPDVVRLPTNREVVVDYTAEAGPTVRGKLQEFFGTLTTPMVDGEPCVVELLTPAGKVAAITDDLARFWTVGYTQVRSELRGRYPKHDWPADPRTAPAQIGTKAAEARKAAQNK